MVEVRLTGKSMQQRIADRLKPSSSPDAVSMQVTHGEGPRRTISTIHHSGFQAEHGKPADRLHDLSGEPRRNAGHNSNDKDNDND